MQTVLYPIAKAILPRLTTCVFSNAENSGRFYDPPGITTDNIDVLVKSNLRFSLQSTMNVMLSGDAWDQAFLSVAS